MNEESQYRRALEVLRDGGVVAMPTDTVYGLCAVATDDAAVRRLLDIKQRPEGQALPLFVAGIEQAELIAELNPLARALAARFWPGPLTIVVPRLPGFRTLAAEGDTVGLRAPADALLREMAAELGPLTGTSANLSGHRETRTATDVRAQLGDAPDLIVDAAVAASGQPSTVVDCTMPDVPRILREGAIPADSVLAAAGD